MILLALLVGGSFYFDGFKFVCSFCWWLFPCWWLSFYFLHWICYCNIIIYHLLFSQYFIWNYSYRLTFTRALSAQPSRQLGFPTVVLLLLILSLLLPLEVMHHIIVVSVLSYCYHCSIIVCDVVDDVLFCGDGIDDDTILRILSLFYYHDDILQLSLL